MPPNILNKELMAKLFNYSLPEGNNEAVKDLPTSEKKQVINNADLPPCRHDDLKPKNTFSVEASMKAYEERIQRGKYKLEAILSELEGNKEACSYVLTHFYVDNVQCSVRKLKKHLMEQIIFCKELQQKYGDKRIIDYTENIKLYELILRRLEGLKIPMELRK